MVEVEVAVDDDGDVLDPGARGGEGVGERDALRARVAELEGCWLIERGQLEHQEPVVWWTGKANMHEQWAASAVDALRFTRELDAQRVIVESHYLRGSARATEHVFLRAAIDAARAAPEGR